MLSPDEFETLHLTGQQPAGVPRRGPATAGGTARKALPGVAAEAGTL